MSFLLTLAVFAGLGLLGSAVRAAAGEVGGLLPGRVSTDEGSVAQPGIIGTLLAGAMASGLSWLLYGPAANAVVIGVKAGGTTVEYGATGSELALAVLIGFSGSQWLKSEADKRLSKATAVAAAKAPQSQALAEVIRSGSPVAALEEARDAS